MRQGTKISNLYTGRSAYFKGELFRCDGTVKPEYKKAVDARLAWVHSALQILRYAYTHEIKFTLRNGITEYTIVRIYGANMDVQYMNRLGATVVFVMPIKFGDFRRFYRLVV